LSALTATFGEHSMAREDREGSETAIEFIAMPPVFL
jgi:hypothetical protein